MNLMVSMFTLSTTVEGWGLFLPDRLPVCLQQAYRQAGMVCCFVFQHGMVGRMPAMSQTSLKGIKGRCTLVRAWEAGGGGKGGKAKEIGGGGGMAAFC